MKFNDLIQESTTTVISFSSREEKELLEFLNRLEPNVEFWIANPFKVDDLISHISTIAQRDLRISQILGQIEEIPPIVVDLGMVTNLNPYNKVDFSFIKKNKRKLILLVRNNRYVRLEEMISTISPRKLLDFVHNAFHFEDGILKQIKSRDYEYIEFDTRV